MRRSRSITPNFYPPQTCRSGGVAGKKRESSGKVPKHPLWPDRKEKPLDPIRKAIAREEMNHYLRDAGITGRSLTLIDAMIAIVIALEIEREPS